MAENNNSLFFQPQRVAGTAEWDTRRRHRRRRLSMCARNFIFKYSYVSIDMFLFELMSFLFW